MTKPGFKEFKSECSVMKFKESKLHGINCTLFKDINVKTEFPDAEYVDFNGKKIPVIPEKDLQAVDFWGYIKSAETYPLSKGPQYAVEGLDPNVFYHRYLHGQNQRLARRVNNMATVNTLLYNIFDAGFYEVCYELRTENGNKPINFIQMGNKMAEKIAASDEDDFYEFRDDSYYDAVSCHQFQSQGLIIYMDTCNRNGIPFHDKVNKQQLRQVQNKSSAVPQGSSLNAISNASKIPDNILIYSFILTYIPQIGLPKEFNSAKLRDLLKQITTVPPGDTITAAINLFIKEKIICLHPDSTKRTKRWSFLDFNPSHHNQQLLKKVFFDTTKERWEYMRDRYSNLGKVKHLPLLEYYYGNVIARHQNSKLLKMGLSTFTQYCSGEISWSAANEMHVYKYICLITEWGYVDQDGTFALKHVCKELNKRTSRISEQIGLANDDDGDIAMN